VLRYRIRDQDSTAPWARAPISRGRTIPQAGLWQQGGTHLQHLPYRSTSTAWWVKKN